MVQRQSALPHVLVGRPGVPRPGDQGVSRRGLRLLRRHRPQPDLRDARLLAEGGAYRGRLAAARLPPELQRVQEGVPVGGRARAERRHGGASPDDDRADRALRQARRVPRHARDGDHAVRRRVAPHAHELRQSRRLDSRNREGQSDPADAGRLEQLPHHPPYARRGVRPREVARQSAAHLLLQPPALALLRRGGPGPDRQSGRAFLRGLQQRRGLPARGAPA